MLDKVGLASHRSEIHLFEKVRTFSYIYYQLKVLFYLKDQSILITEVTVRIYKTNANLCEL